MFFFFVGGVEQQVGKVVERAVSRCINCGSKADVVEAENVLKLFFVPVWRWPAKKSLLHCPNCNLFFPREYEYEYEHEKDDRLLTCSSCDRLVQPDYRFCPFCGAAL